MKHTVKHKAITLMLTVVITTVSITLWAQETGVQQALLSGGEYHQTHANSVSWSLGETAIRTLAAGGYIITQGFQQSKLTITAIDDETDFPIGITAYPNPTSSHVFIRVNGEVRNLRYEVYTANGQRIEENLFDSNPQKIIVDHLAPGVYLIRIRLDNQLVKTFKVVKN